MTYPMTIAGLRRELPLCKVADDFYIGAFIMFGDAEITVACAKELLARAPKEYDYLLTAEAKSIPLIHEMARQSGASEYFVARKGMKVYLTDPIHVQVRSITTQHDQDLYLSGEDAAKMKGKKVLIVDDVISTGESLHALEELVHQAGGEVAGRMAVLAEGDAQKRKRYRISGKTSHLQRRRNREGLKLQNRNALWMISAVRFLMLLRGCSRFRRKWPRQRQKAGYRAQTS